MVTDPTVREIWAATFRDRVVHHLLYDFLEPVFEPLFIHQSYACRPGKGTRRAVEDLRVRSGSSPAMDSGAPTASSSISGRSS